MATALEAVQALQQRFGSAVGAPATFADRLTGRDEVTVTVAREQLAAVCRSLKEAGFDFLVDICGVDNHDSDPRFAVHYLLYSFKNRCLLRLRVGVPEEDATVASVTSVWKGADWHERECYDMLGIRFTGHPDLRRILMWEGYPFHPLRKEFPLEGQPSNVPDVAFTEAAPLQGGPFVTVHGPHVADREPAVRENALPEDIRSVEPNKP
ncbi:MAG: NADH-quinone oxidoreductase subunit C [Verrucomicrobia bacterium]|nr:NADH-quinone oxidoreductase subunit C [Verrucomicrobiota bacterium]